MIIKKLLMYLIKIIFGGGNHNHKKTKRWKINEFLF